VGFAARAYKMRRVATLRHVASCGSSVRNRVHSIARRRAAVGTLRAACYWVPLRGLALPARAASVPAVCNLPTRRRPGGGIGASTPNRADALLLLTDNT